MRRETAVLRTKQEMVILRAEPALAVWATEVPAVCAGIWHPDGTGMVEKSENKENSRQATDDNRTITGR